MAIEVVAQTRKLQGTGASRRLRRTGKVPGILYGGKKPAVTIELDHNPLYHQLRNERFHASILTLTLDGAKEQVGLITHVLNEMDIRCLPEDLPEFIQVDLSLLAVGHSIHVRELALPKGVEPALRGNENPTVASAQIPKAAIAEEEEAAAAAAAAGVVGALAPAAEAVAAAADVPTVKQKAPEPAAPAAEDKGGKGGKGEKDEKGDRGDKGDKK